MRTESRQASKFAGKRVHFIGIAGCGMSGLATMLQHAGAIVSGSDPKPNSQVRELIDEGARVSLEQDGRLLSRDIDLVVRTAAIPPTNAEYLAARNLGLKQVKYAELLGRVMAERFGVAISGTHGKTTTTSMTAYALLKCGLDPSFVIGGTVEQLGGSSRSGGGEAFVVEACEFDRSFHNLPPKVAVITNIEADHLDCYPGGLDEIVESFRVFAKRVPADGQIICNGQDAQVRKAVGGLPASIETVGLEDRPTLTWSARVSGIENGCYCGEIYHFEHRVADVALAVPGRHNLFNATAAIAACYACGLEPELAAEALASFKGADRRMSERGRLNGAIILDDYGHHPTEIRTTLRAIKEKYRPQRLICVFQPHQYSRTRYLLDDFGRAFVDADLTILSDIYAARDSEDDRRSVASADLVQRIRKNGQTVEHIAMLEDIVSCLRREAREGDVIVTMGAGNVCDVGRDLVGS
jgi:UDP-N-acetylmuramate--alanine ligase